MQSIRFFCSRQYKHQLLPFLSTCETPWLFLVLHHQHVWLTLKLSFQDKSSWCLNRCNTVTIEQISPLVFYPMQLLQIVLLISKKRTSNPTCLFQFYSSPPLWKTQFWNKVINNNLYWIQICCNIFQNDWGDVLQNYKNRELKHQTSLPLLD